MNPCPCGHLGNSRHACICLAPTIERYRSRISGPLLDRHDLHVELPARSRKVAAIAAEPGEIDPCHVESLLGWLRGFKHHWPPSFTAILGPAGEQCLVRLEALPADPGRYLKLRRIAIENLSHIFLA